MTELAQRLMARTKEFALRVIRMTGSLPRGHAGEVLGKQVLRSATSIGANYREAYPARSANEFVAKMGDCLRELEETSYWFELIEASALLPSAKLAGLRTEANELTAIFVTILHTKKGSPNS